GLATAGWLHTLGGSRGDGRRTDLGAAMEAECILRRAGAVRRSARGPIALRGWVAGILLAATLALFGPLLGARAQAERHEGYQGFSLTCHAGVGTEMESVAHVQIDEVLGVGLPADTIGFLKTVPVEVVEKTATSPGHYGNKRVEIDRTVLTQREKPILLHELMHALHDQRLPDGFATLEILTFFRRAQTLAAFAP